MIIHRVIVVTDTADFGAIDTAAIIAKSIDIYSKQHGNGHIKTAVLKTGMAKDYSGILTLLILLDPEQRTGIRNEMILHSEPGEGKDICDSTNAAINKLLQSARKKAGFSLMTAMELARVLSKVSRLDGLIVVY